MDPIQQIISKISQVTSILIITPGNNGDSLAAGLGLRAFLRKLEKEVTLLSYTEVTTRFDFLPESADISTQIDLTKSLVIGVSTKRVKLGELSYKKGPDQLSIFLKPQGGEFTPQDISFNSSNFPFELIILIGVGTLEHLGEFYNRNTSLFFETAILNMDFKASNENYGQFNLVDLTATSCSEVVLDLINKFESSLIDESIATQLLAGIIAETNSFQHARTTPQTFLKASQLVTLGAKQQEIVGHLYKSKSLGLLKLWGRVLARLQQDLDNLLVYSAVNQIDLVKSDATEEDANSIIKEMVGQLTFAKVFLFLKEDDSNQTTVFCQTLIPLNLITTFAQFQPLNLNPQGVKFTIRDSVVNAERQVLELLKQEVAKRTAA